MKKTILFMDNKLDFLDVHARLLEQADYYVLRADTLVGAKEILSNEHLHLAILDMRMEDDNDKQDISGLMLAQQETYRSIPKIILTAHPSYEYAREALGLALNGSSPAVNFIGKAEGPEALLQAVEQVFTQHVRLNWDLTIRWRNNHSFFLLINLIEPEIDSDRLPDRIDELEDLFRKLFYDCIQITVGRLLFQEKGLVILKVFTHGERGTEEQCIISVGRKQQVNQENDRYDRFVPKGAERGSTTVKMKKEETTHFAATTYTLFERGLENIRVFREFYQSESSETIQTTLDNLFMTTLDPWYKEGKRLKKLELAKLISSTLTISPTELERRVETLCKEVLAAGLARLDYSAHQLTLHLLEGSPVSLQNPISHLFQERIIIAQPVIYGTIHGRLNVDNILVNRMGRTWLTYFSQAGQGPLLQDFVSLETAIRLELLETTNMSMRYEMEHRLLAASSLDQTIDLEDLTPEIQKVLYTVHRVRYLASTIIGHDLEAYLAGLLYSAVDYLTSYDPAVRYIRRELASYLHSLLAAAMLCQTLTPSPQKELPVQATHSLLVDKDNKQVWVEGRPVILSPQEFELLYFLYQHKGQLCSRITILEEVFGVSDDPNLSASERRRMEDGRLNTTMARLKRKIEPNNNHPKYIITVRSQGYRLEVEYFSSTD